MTISNISSKVPGLIVTFHIEPPWGEKRTVSSNSADHMTSMATKSSSLDPVD